MTYHNCVVSNKFRINLFCLTQLIFIVFCNQTYAQSNCRCERLLSEKEFITIDKKDSIKLFNTIKLLKNSKNKSCNYEGLVLEFEHYNNELQSDKAKKLLEEQEVLQNSIDCDNDFLFKLIYNKARYFHANNDLEKLSVFAFKALEEAERLNDSEKEIKAIQELVYLFTRLNEDEKNWNHIKRAESLILDLKNPELHPHYYSWLAYEYENKYTITERVTLLDSVLLFINKAKKGAFKYQKFNEITKYYRVNEANAYHRGNLQQALIYSDSAIYYGKKIKGYKNIAPLYLAKAWNHLDLGELDEANIWMDSSLYFNRGKQTASSMMLYSEASEIYEGAGKLNKAFESFKMYSHLKDSILNIEKVEKINELEQKYLKAENEQKIISLEKTKQYYLFLIIAGLLGVLTLIFFFRQRTLKNRHKILKTEQRLNRARINPHFFFNAMASLQSLALQEKSTKTTLYTARLAKIMRQSLESTYEEVVTVEHEIDFLTQYLEIQKLRYPDKFEYEFHVDTSLEINELKLPGMLMQPFVENAIEHGFKDLDYIGKLDITFKEKGDDMSVIVEDNGAGVAAVENIKTYKSRAMQIIKDRLYLFNKQHKSNAMCEVINPNQNGFKIIVTLPKLY